MKRAHSGFLCALLGCVVLAVAVAGAQENKVQAVRLSLVEGQVRLAANGQTIAENAVVNTPLFEGTEISTGEDGRAEVQFDDGSIARLTPNSALLLRKLPAGEGLASELELESGLAYFEIQDSGQGASIRVFWGTAAVGVNGFTVLRVNFDTPPGEVAILNGNARLTMRGAASGIDLIAGESVKIDAQDPLASHITESVEHDTWDDWNSDRDQDLNKAAQSRTRASEGFANSANPAWGDLDSSGVWYNLPGDGYIWSPYDASAPDWDPYGNGYWMWTPRSGYIWVSGYGWGYLPFQCGRWNFYDGFGWGWAPGVCAPWWWETTVYVGINLGHGPREYRPIRPPFPPRGVGVPHRPIPMIAVNRPKTPGVGTLPERRRNAPVTIAGATASTLRPIAPRPVYDRNSGRVGGDGGRSPYASPTASGSAKDRPAYFRSGSGGSVPGQPNRPGVVNPNHPAGNAPEGKPAPTVGAPGGAHSGAAPGGSTHSGGSSGSSGGHAGGGESGGHSGGGSAPSSSSAPPPGNTTHK